VKIKNLKPGMILGERIVKKGNIYTKKQEPLIYISDIFRSTKDWLSSEIPLKLGEKEVKKLKKLHAEKKLDFSEVRINKTTAFAPFLFLGSLVTYLIQGSLFYYLIV
jgi:hypothetical protein